MTAAQLSLADVTSVIIAFCTALAVVIPFHKKQPKNALAETVTNLVLAALMLLAIFSRHPWAVLAVMGLIALSVSIFFMVKPQINRMDYLLLAFVWPWFFFLLSQKI